MEQNFNPGDVVVLKSNPIHLMTVEKQNEDKTYLCVWQNAKKNNKKETDNYAGVLLKIWVSPAGVTRLRSVH